MWQGKKPKQTKSLNFLFFKIILKIDIGSYSRLIF